MTSLRVPLIPVCKLVQQTSCPFHVNQEFLDAPGHKSRGGSFNLSVSFRVNWLRDGRLDALKQ
jgi:hypothetical protein